ncbi:hydroxypyruvate isomerase family protein [Pelagibius sp. Alg239-R121]|uniref:hydroxypyruvate isomerase family protein n=1 Tax=Pelagibius sp. Alg239-R121 TaxID=2993448 RepID=UPI0024A67C0C|nr:TIM barrel protein [Pelagibius sp. Alg239-R121]
MSGFSANLGFLWTELTLPDAIRAAAAAGFDAVECHWPYDTPVEAVKSALNETGLPMLGLNTVRGNVAAGDNGLAALPGREDEARAAIDQAVSYAQAIAAHNIHVMAGFAQGADARETFITNLGYACDAALPHGITILIEPLNHHDAPGYFLNTADQAAEIIEAVGAQNLKLMFDCYHLQIMQGDITRRLEQFMPLIGHIQIAAVPSRGEPGDGELDYRHVMQTIRSLGFTAPVGAEYRPVASTEAGLSWMQKIA